MNDPACFLPLEEVIQPTDDSGVADVLRQAASQGTPPSSSIFRKLV